MNPNNLTLGCADEVDVIITAADLETYAGSLAWSSVTYSMVLDEVSEATVTVPDALGGLRCNVEFGSALLPWRYGIRIERNGELVWSGPIVRIDRPVVDGAAAGFVEVTAMDAMAWSMKRTTPNFLSFSNADAGAVFRAVLDAGMAPHNPAGLDCPDFSTSYTMTREVLPLDFEYTFDILTELAQSAVDYFVWRNELAVFDTVDWGWWVLRDGVKTRLAPTSDPFGRYIYGLFTAEAFDQRPGFSIDGMSQGNNVYVPGTDSGEAGFRRYWTASDVDPLDGLLTYVDVSPLYRPQPDQVIVNDAVFQQRADSLLALRRNAIVTVTGGALSADAPVRFQDLLPGSLWAIDIGEQGIEGLVAVQRLKRVDVEVSASDAGIVERVTPSLIPIGTDETILG